MKFIIIVILVLIFIIKITNKKKEKYEENSENGLEYVKGRVIIAFSKIILFIMFLFFLIFLVRFYEENMFVGGKDFYIEGRVIDEDTNEGLENAFVQIFTTKYKFEGGFHFVLLPFEREIFAFSFSTESLDDIVLTDKDGYFKTRYYDNNYLYNSRIFQAQKYYKIKIRVAKPGYYAKSEECEKTLKKKYYSMKEMFKFGKQKKVMDFWFMSKEKGERLFEKPYLKGYQESGNYKGISFHNEKYLDMSILYYYESLKFNYKRFYEFMNYELNSNKIDSKKKYIYENALKKYNI